MTNPARRGRAWLWFWSGLAAVAAGLLLYATIFVYAPANQLTVTVDGGGEVVVAADVPTGEGAPAEVDVRTAVGAREQWTLWISALTLVVSVIGLISSTFLGWRQELREARLERIEVEHMRIEVEKLRLELKQLRSESSGAAPIDAAPTQPIPSSSPEPQP